MKTVDFAIDLGTTNSLIAECKNGEVTVFKNPMGFKETLPSVVAFRKNRIIIGDKARELIDRGDIDVVSHFKRKMGTDQSYWINDLTDTLSPIDLSSYVLKELMNFVPDFKATSCVITIPASFDTVQSKATTEAGYLAGFKQVYLLQEPIAASLAYFNSLKEESQGEWLVYDLGGGTFDVAILKSTEGEIKIIDHIGDNYFGGLDFDSLILKKIIIPKLEQMGSFESLEQDLTSASGKYLKNYYQILKKCEDVKIELSSHTESDMEFEMEDDNGELLDVYFSITRQQFNDVIKDKVDESVELIKELLQKNNLASTQLKQVLFVGGSTYIPLIKEKIEAELNVSVNNAIDPTNAVAVGAAYYAGSKVEHNLEPIASVEISKEGSDKSNLDIKLNVSQASNDLEEYLAGMVKGDLDHYFRVARKDGGFDSGILRLTEEFGEFVRLATGCLNEFEFRVFDSNQKEIAELKQVFSISQGQYSIQGQPLPEDICIEVDDKIIETTKLEVLFDRKSILPLEKTIVKHLTKSIKKGSSDSIVITILEGDKNARPSSCKKVGVISVNGSNVDSDLIKGTDIEIVIKINESRDIEVSALLLLNDQEYKEVFTPMNRVVDINKLYKEMELLNGEIEDELFYKRSTEDFEELALLTKLNDQCKEAIEKLRNLKKDDITDLKYQLEDIKRVLAKKLDKYMSTKGNLQYAEEYIESKNNCLELLKENNDSSFQTQYEAIVKEENDFLSNENLFAIRNKIRQLDELTYQIDIRRPETIRMHLDYYSMLGNNAFINSKKANKDIEMGFKALDASKPELALSKMAEVYHNLKEKGARPDKNYTGLG